MNTQHSAVPLMTIGALAHRVDAHPRTLRYYERIGLLRPTERTSAGYRLYSERDAQRLSFIRRAQAFGLSLSEIAGILSVRDGGAPPCRRVGAIATERIAALDDHLRELLALRSELSRLAEAAADIEPACQGSDSICLAFDPTPLA